MTDSKEVTHSSERNSEKCVFIALPSADAFGGLLCATCTETFEKDPMCPKQGSLPSKQGAVSMTTDKKKTINYIVTTQGWSGKKVTECETEGEARVALDDCSLGSLTSVYSPTGMCVNQFTPF